MDFAQMPPDWPHRDRARRIASRPHDWCVIDAGAGPVLLLLHGAGGSGHSFRTLIPLLTPHYRVIVPDLPGQGFTRSGARSRYGIDPMAEDLAELCRTLDIAPAAVIGHSAGGALALRLAEILPLRAIVGLNAALGAFDGAAGVLFPLLAKVLSVTPFIPHVVARLWGNAATVQRLLVTTGSPLAEDGVAQYIALVKDPAHVDATLGMMAQWRLEEVMPRLMTLPLPVLLIASTGDRAVPARISREAAAQLPDGSYAEIPARGHLMHEEAAEDVAALLLPWLAAELSGTA
ncbi:alpha/beta fold hydrolase [Rhodobacter sp. CCP-1]|uniref:Alpha/beta fold hydrolase n=2 Tax=Paragemmobacter ruber TaxID=1985673 RepID=A0ABW9Y088_9RHOB|nr:alpha/beta fold hydrolase [Rhodobacter ruber]